MAASACELPCIAWEGLWDSLIYSDNIKLKLLDYIHATLVLSDANVDCEFTYVSSVSNDPNATLQSTSCRGTELSCCMVHQEQEKLRYVAHSLKSSPYVSRIGKKLLKLSAYLFSSHSQQPF